MSQIEIKYRCSGRTTAMLGAVRDSVQQGENVLLVVPLGVIEVVNRELKDQLDSGKLIVEYWPFEKFVSDTKEFDFENMISNTRPGYKLFIDHSLISSRFGKMIDQHFGYY